MNAPSRGLLLGLAVIGLASAARAGSTKPVLPFQDDYARALAEARAKKLPIFVEAWAPW